MNNDIRFKPCIRCGRVQRDKRGECYPCKLESNRVWRAKKRDMDWRLHEMDRVRPKPSLAVRPHAPGTRYRKPVRKPRQDDWLK